MNPQTFGRAYNTGRIAPVQCVKEDTLTDLNIKACMNTISLPPA